MKEEKEEKATAEDAVEESAPPEKVKASGSPGTKRKADAKEL